MEDEENKEILWSRLQMLRNVYHKPNPDGLNDDCENSIMSLGWTFIPESEGPPCPLLGRLLTWQHFPVTVSSHYPVAQESVPLTKGDLRDQEADMPHGPFSR
ncbi:hypothetical protein BTVI_137738 [Pitangus sulphuratus]|nr:hypothetical protein BTVI_137738 [Pitangus sulphuratus]